ncbi:MAG: T9SS type A sorting domain-containing protein [bacterium]|nr:T9SS type A sorting domain-containing protein [Candidatus Limimorpha equi]
MKYLLEKMLLLVFAILSVGDTVKAQQTEIQAVITRHNGDEQIYQLNENDRISFPNDETLVITQNGTDIQIPISEIRKITFDEVLATAENEAKNIGIFPNPADNSFTISGINGFQQMNIYSFDGKLVKCEIIDCGQSIDITELPQGLYYVNINKQNFKLIKL